MRRIALELLVATVLLGCAGPSLQRARTSAPLAQPVRPGEESSLASDVAVARAPGVSARHGTYFRVASQPGFNFWSLHLRADEESIDLSVSDRGLPIGVSARPRRSKDRCSFPISFVVDGQTFTASGAVIISYAGSTPRWLSHFDEPLMSALAAATSVEVIMCGHHVMLDTAEVTEARRFGARERAP